MSTIHMKDLEIHTFGELPEVGSDAPDFILTSKDLTTKSLQDFSGKAMLINVYPSIDTSVCFESVKTFSDAAAKKKDMVVVCVSMDLPFALQRVATGESFDNILFLSDYRNRDFGDRYGLTMADGPIAGMLARAVIVLNKDHKVVYRELVEDVTSPPDYNKGLSNII